MAGRGGGKGKKEDETNKRVQNHQVEGLVQKSIFLIQSHTIFVGEWTIPKAATGSREKKFFRGRTRGKASGAGMQKEPPVHINTFFGRGPSYPCAKCPRVGSW
jgi:hypothetical protein